MKKWILVIVVVGLLGWAVYDFVISGDEAAEEEKEDDVGIEVGDTAPNFTLETLDGEEVMFLYYRSLIVLLYFSSTWCTAGRAEMPDMDKDHEEKAADEVVILGVNLTS